MSQQGGEVESGEAASKENDDKVVTSETDKEEEENLENPETEGPPVLGAGSRETAEPPDKGAGKEPEENLQNLQFQEPNLEEIQLEKKKPSRNLLKALRMRNARGLEQDHDLLGPGTMIHVKWPEAFKKENTSPWDTPWGYICLTQEAQVSKPPDKAAWNWAHPTRPDIIGHIKLEPDWAWEIVRGIATKEQERSRIDRNKNPGHEYNKLKAPSMTKVPLNVKKRQPESIQMGMEEFLEHAQSHPEVFIEGPLEADGVLENQKTVDITADSRNFERTVQPQQSNGTSLNSSTNSRVTTGAGVSETRFSTTSSNMEGFLNGFDSTLKHNLFNHLLKNVPITNHEVQVLVAREWEALRVLRSLNKGIQENKSPRIIKRFWDMLQPARQDFIESYNMVAVLCLDTDQEEELEEDLGMLNLSDIFNDTSRLGGVSTGLDKLIKNTQAALSEQYGEVWAVGDDSHQKDAPGKLSGGTGQNQKSPEDKGGEDEVEEGEKGKGGDDEAGEGEEDEGNDEGKENGGDKKIEKPAMKKIIPTSTPPSTTGQPESEKPMATSKQKANNQNKEQEKMILHRFQELARQQKEMERKGREQKEQEEHMKKMETEQREKEEHFKLERAQLERMRKINEEQVERMRKNQEEDRKKEEEERKRKQEKMEEYKKIQEENQKMTRELRRLKREEEENRNWEKENEEITKRKNAEQDEIWRRREEEIKLAEDKIEGDKAALKELKRAAEEEKKKEQKRMDRERKRGKERLEDLEAKEADNKNKTKSKISNPNPNPKITTNPDGDDVESDVGKGESPRVKVRKSVSQRTNSITSEYPNVGITAIRKEFKLMSKRLTRNLEALEDLKAKIEEEPTSLTNGNEELKQLRTNELTQKMEALEVEYESDDDLQDELEDLKTLMNDNTATYKIVKRKLDKAEGGMNNSTNLRLIGMEVSFTPIDVEVLSSPTLYAFLSDVLKRVEKSPLYLTSMRDNLADKILEALTKGNENIVTQLRLSTTNHHDWEEIVSYLVSKFGGALRTQEIAINHHQEHDRIGFPLESSIIQAQFATIKQHLKAVGSLREMIQYHKKTKSSSAASAFLQQGGYTQRYLTVLNEKLPLFTQSTNIDKLETLSHEEGFALLEGQLMDLHKSAQTMSNRYCASQTVQTLLVSTPNRGKEPEKKPDDSAVNKKLEELSQELRIVKNKGEREVNQLKKLIEDPGNNGNQGRVQPSSWQQPSSVQPSPWQQPSSWQQPPKWQPPAAGPPGTSQILKPLLAH